MNKVKDYAFKIVRLLIVLFFYFLFPTSSYAIENPLERPNNIFGIHILFPSEIEEAEKFANSGNGEWGYLTIPIQSRDRDLDKWQKFMDDAKRLKLIPVVRLATEPSPLDSSVWRKPNNYDLIDFANFLNSLSWPVKNRYVVLFNEVNHSLEWGGEAPNPYEYGEIVKYANEVFKSRNPNFYLILAGMDVSAPNDYIRHINGYTYLENLTKDPNVLDSVDAFSSHSYPNPDFSSPPLENKKNNIASYRYEYDLLNKKREKKLPVFITETGWSDKNLPQSVISSYYRRTIEEIWSKDHDKIIAITPFLLNSENGPFDNFSFMKNGKEKDYYKTFVLVSKVKGKPTVEPLTISEAESVSPFFASLTFLEKNEKETKNELLIKLYFKTILGIL